MSSLAQEAYEKIKDSIVKNDFKPGDCLSESALARSFGMSRTPIREAIKTLSNEGFVDIYNGVGAIIKHITVKEIKDIFEVRIALECAAVDSALENIKEEDIKPIEEDWLYLKKCVISGEKIGINKISEYDYGLHKLLIMKCSNDFLRSIIDGIRIKILRFQKISAAVLGNELDTIEQHLEIIELIKDKDAEKLKDKLKAHIRYAENLMLRNPNIRY
jgi:DNA-binding GntR family transcriptional regulator